MKNKQEIYVSSACQKYKEYINYMNKHPIKWIEDITGINLTLYQKIKLLIIHYRMRFKEKSYNRLIEKYMK